MTSSKSIFVSLAYVIAITILLFFTDIQDFPVIIGCFTLSFMAYVWLISGLLSWKYALWIGWGIRVVALFSFPGLSDDIYRFLWDGWLITEGENPFSSLPINVEYPLGEYQKFLLGTMNSPEYYSVYPPVLQALFASCIWLIPFRLLFQVFFFKAVFLACEAITMHFSLRLLERLSIRKDMFLWYFLNPLIIVEGIGNLHMEIVMISGFAAFLYYWGSGAQSSKAKSIVALALSIGAKLMTILVMPFMLKRMPIKHLVMYCLGLGILLGGMFLPMFISTYENFGKGLDLYFQKFEFNASIYYLCREIGFLVKGYNIIGKLGPLLAVSSAIGILIIAWKEREYTIASLCKNLTYALTLYYFLGTTVHPWYTSLLVFLAVFSKLQYPVLWSFLAIFSYAKYYNGEEWYYPMIILEYTLLWGFMVYAYYKKRQKDFCL